MTERDRTEPREIELTTLREGFAALACEPDAVEAAGDCPEPETIYTAVHGELSSGELRDVVAHTASCPRCAEEWRLAMAFSEEIGEDEEPLARPAAPTRPTLRLLPMAAALVVALLAAGVWLTVGPDREQTPEQTAPVYRDSPGAASSQIVSLVPEGGALDRDAPVLRWRLGEESAPEGTTYDLLVSTEDLRTVAEVTDLESPSYTLPAEALEGLPPGTGLQWTVDAHLPDGTRVGSPLFVTSVPSIE